MVSAGARLPQRVAMQQAGTEYWAARHYAALFVLVTLVAACWSRCMRPGRGLSAGGGS